jgi:heterodisulfide reductase subunit A-like polyferredoxin
MLASSGYVTEVDEDLCIGCGDCSTFCQFGALEVEDGINTVNYGKCMGCGVCSSKCDQGALSLALDEAKGIPLQVCSLMDETFQDIR